ncbi:hypothetical protein L1049_002670 [Liquidambar formosana]|uniref:VAN3-binding protein-like auxin canalisation domain-containing protein n=1 Tax=Liquidambar formosana TaxID=63359 RepID=A0AAP0N3F2_LIQFO
MDGSCLIGGTEIILFSQNLLSPQYDNSSSEEHEEKLEVKETKEGTAPSNRKIVNKVDNVWTWLTGQKSAPSGLPMHTPLNNNWDLNKWLKGKSLASLLRCHKGKKKEEVRLSRAKVHAALSVARLAAAVAGFSANNSSEEVQHINHMITKGALEWDNNMSAIVATAAALVAAVCAEAAESAGAHRSHVASVINSGLATQTPTEMITLTASAATCLRGAATLNSRAMADAYFPKNQQLLKLGAQLSVLMPSGKMMKPLLLEFSAHITSCYTSVHHPQINDQTTSFMDKIMTAIGEPKGARGYYLLSLKTSNGDIKLLFEDEKQSTVWITTISNLLQMHNS